MPYTLVPGRCPLRRYSCTRSSSVGCPGALCRAALSAPKVRNPPYLGASRRVSWPRSPMASAISGSGQRASTRSTRSASVMSVAVVANLTTSAPAAWHLRGDAAGGGMAIRQHDCSGGEMGSLRCQAIANTMNSAPLHQLHELWLAGRGLVVVGGHDDLDARRDGARGCGGGGGRRKNGGGESRSHRPASSGMRPLPQPARLPVHPSSCRTTIPAVPATAAGADLRRRRAPP